jgi:hypothetical protein
VSTTNYRPAQPNARAGSDLAAFDSTHRPFPCPDEPCHTDPNRTEPYPTIQTRPRSQFR